MISVTRAALVAAAVGLVWSPPQIAHAGEKDYAVIHLEGAMAASHPQRDRFRLGGGGALSTFRGIGVHFSIGARLRVFVLGDGPAPSDPTLRDPGRGGLGAVTLVARLGFPPRRQRVRGVGFFVDGGGGGAITGTFLRATVEAAVGWGFSVRRFVIAPVFRYVQVLQPSNQLDPRDARLLVLAFEIHDLRRPREARVPPRTFEPGSLERIDDRDDDGIVDARDACIEAPEDVDGFQDEDGCPDPGTHVVSGGGGQ
ncbi:MAG: hypothetical protein H6721_09910 [Sandaracinus sp.]|jgi:hypothetical protein|nr:hypothetical protein [Sandaracinus sp.]MCB9616047.1 hypothetical protein [Sandaracinus sp.]MCB9632430.1 hypothetical protein [Sandaracinus sp.]